MTPSRDLVVSWLGLVLILLASAAGKLYYKGSVTTALAKLGMKSEFWSQAISVGLAPAEMIIALWLATGWLWRWSTLATFGLVTVFNVVLWRLQKLGYDGGCGCFGGKSAGPVRTVHLIRNAAMFVAALLLLMNAWGGATSPAPLWALPGAVLLHASLILGVLLVLYLLAGAAEKLLFRAYWE
ncbi:MAG: MauE/DoxX family redox-associated membrane protein [Gemmatimonadota bacterium]